MTPDRLRVCTLHAHYSPARLDHVTAVMRSAGPPTLRGHQDAATGWWFAFEGTHRLMAAFVLGLVPRMVEAGWRRGARALDRARVAAARRGLDFPRAAAIVDVLPS